MKAFGSQRACFLAFLTTGRFDVDKALVAGAVRIELTTFGFGDRRSAN